jgi:RNA polymerase sigma factor (sigma-70 family)
MDPGDDRPLLGPRNDETQPVSQLDPAEAAAVPLPAPALTAAQVEEFSAFYRTHVERVVVFLRFQGATWAEAADAAQEAMTRAYQRWGSLTRPDAWVRTVATREFIRRRVNGREDPAELTPEPVTALLRDPTADAAESDAEELQVRQRLQQLSPRQRQVLAWTYDGYTPTEIAQHLSTPDHPVTSDAVRANLRLARRTLSRLLGPQGAQP